MCLFLQDILSSGSPKMVYGLTCFFHAHGFFSESDRKVDIYREFLLKHDGRDTVSLSLTFLQFAHYGQFCPTSKYEISILLHMVYFLDLIKKEEQSKKYSLHLGKDVLCILLEYQLCT